MRFDAPLFTIMRPQWTHVNGEFHRNEIEQSETNETLEFLEDKLPQHNICVIKAEKVKSLFEIDAHAIAS